MFVIPVNLQIIILGQLGEVTEVLLHLVHVQPRAELHHGTLRVGEEPPSVKVAGHHVPPHLDAPVPGPPPLASVGPVLDTSVVELQPRPAQLSGAHLGLQAGVVGELSLDAQHLPVAVTGTQHVVNPLQQ